MNWDAVAAIGENVGALAVVISVFYLAIQVRKQTAESKLGATRDLSAQYLTPFRLIYADEELSNIFLAAVQDYESLETTNRLRASCLFNDVLRNVEQQYLHSRTSHADDEHLESLSVSIQEFIELPGVQTWWKLSKESFAKDFRNYMNDVVHEAAKKPRASTFR
jgi:hypothetical protein